ncbi:hypothetical protein [Nocardioides alcanivorans]|nr:hypothetical protein [Nocardioides alcanivorans]
MSFEKRHGEAQLNAPVGLGCAAVDHDRDRDLLTAAEPGAGDLTCSQMG